MKKIKTKKFKLRINLFYTDSIYSISDGWMNDNYTKFKYKTQLLHIYHEFHCDNVYVVSVYLLLN